MDTHIKNKRKISSDNPAQLIPSAELFAGILYIIVSVECEHIHRIYNSNFYYTIIEMYTYYTTNSISQIFICCVDSTYIYLYALCLQPPSALSFLIYRALCST